MMKQILTTFLLLFSLTLSAQTVDVVGPKKKQQTTVPAKPKLATPAAKPQAKPTPKPQQPKANSKPQTKQPSISSPSGYENGHGYVDLGLSVKWATMNVGASSLTDHGGYYAWGETRTKSIYDWSTYKWCRGSNSSMTKYCSQPSLGTIDNKTILELSDDAAHMNWGGFWRMPTEAEQMELSDNCTWSNAVHDGIKGIIATSKKNGNSIFIPQTGYYENGTLKGGGSYWWSASCSDNTSFFGCVFQVYGPRGIYSTFNYRYCGLSVRAVCP